MTELTAEKLEKKYKISIEKAKTLRIVLNSEHLSTITNEDIKLEDMVSRTGLALSTIKSYRGALIAADLLEKRGTPTYTPDTKPQDLEEKYNISPAYAKKLKAALNPEYFPLLTDTNFSPLEIHEQTDLDAISIRIYRNALKHAGFIKEEF